MLLVDAAAFTVSAALIGVPVPAALRPPASASPGGHLQQLGAGLA